MCFESMTWRACVLGGLLFLIKARKQAVAAGGALKTQENQEILGCICIVN